MRKTYYQLILNACERGHTPENCPPLNMEIRAIANCLFELDS